MVAVTKGNVAISRESITLVKDSMERKRQGDIEATPGGNIKPKCPVAAHVTLRAAGNVFFLLLPTYFANSATSLSNSQMHTPLLFCSY